MHFTFLSLFPEFFVSPMQQSIVKRAQEKGIISWNAVNIREYSQNKHRTVDDVPYGGLHGMLMQADPVAKSIAEAKAHNPNAEVIFFSPVGLPFTQSVALEKANNGKDKILICGHYEGIDQRVIDCCVDAVYCIGNAVVSGGEIPALFFSDAIIRLLPNAISDQKSHEEESFSEVLFGKGEYPQYTRPEVWNNIRVPYELTSGNHAQIEEWKMKNLVGLSAAEQKMLWLKQKVFSPKKPKKYKSFYLRTPEVSDAQGWVETFSDPSITQYLLVSNIGLSEEESFLASENKNLFHLTLTAVEKTTKAVMANMSLYFEPQNPSQASFGIVIKKPYHNKGLGTALTKTMVSLGFEHFSYLQKIILWVFPDNTIAQRVYEKAGFTKVGLQKKQQYKDGIYHDVLLYEIIRP